MAKKLKLCIGADGSGTCFQAVIDGSNFYNFDPVLAYTNNPGCFAMERARRHGIHVIELNPKDYGSRREHELVLEEELAKHDFGAIVMLGDERMKTGEFIDGYAKRRTPILNTHPAPAPQFRGLNGYAWALGNHPEAVKRNEWTCVTFHRIDADMDMGEIIAQCPVPIYEGDTEDELKERGLKIEHFQIVRCLDYLARGRIMFDDEQKTADALDRHGVPFSSYYHSLEIILKELEERLPDGRFVIKINSRVGTMTFPTTDGHTANGIDSGIPRNLLFTYFYRQVKALRQQGIEVDFHFDGMNIHPIIMRSDLEKGEKPY